MTQLELNLARDIKNNKKCLFRYIGQQRKMAETVPLPMSEIGDMATIDIEKAEVLNNFSLLWSSLASAPAIPDGSSCPKGTSR